MTNNLKGTGENHTWNDSFIRRDDNDLNLRACFCFSRFFSGVFLWSLTNIGWSLFGIFLCNISSCVGRILYTTGFNFLFPIHWTFSNCGHWTLKIETDAVNCCVKYALFYANQYWNKIYFIYSKIYKMNSIFSTKYISSIN